MIMIKHFFFYRNTCWVTNTLFHRKLFNTKVNGTPWLCCVQWNINNEWFINSWHFKMWGTKEINSLEREEGEKGKCE